MHENKNDQETEGVEKQREDILRILNNTAEFIIQNKIFNLVLVDRGMRPLAATLRQYFNSTDFAEKFQAIYPDLRAPHFYFINPWGFLNKQDHGTYKAWKKYEDGWSKFDEGIEHPDNIKDTVDDVVEDLETQHPYLTAKESKSKPTLIVDTCAHSGDALKPILNTFKAAGFTSLKIEVVSEPDKSSGIVADLSIFTENEKRCKPFGSHYSVRKTFDRVISKPTQTSTPVVWDERQVKKLLTDLGMLPLPKPVPGLTSNFKDEHDLTEHFKNRITLVNSERSKKSRNETNKIVGMIKTHLRDITDQEE